MDTNALRSLSYGMYIVTSGTETKCNGQIANTVFQITSQPPTIAVAINKQNFTYEYIKSKHIFAVSVLSKNASLEFIGNFGFRCGRTVDKFEGVRYKTGKTGTRIVLDYSISYLEVEITQEVDAGSHTVFIGKLVDAEVLNNEEPMTYAHYHEFKKGTTPKSAPTYSQTTKAEEVRKNMKYRCTICGYIYDPIQGDPDSGIVAETPFEKLPSNWICPLCGATKDQFEKIES